MKGDSGAAKNEHLIHYTAKPEIFWDFSSRARPEVVMDNVHLSCEAVWLLLGKPVAGVQSSVHGEANIGLKKRSRSNA